MADTIKEFLVGLGFSVDQSSQAKFEKALKSAEKSALALGAAIAAAAAAISAAVVKMSSDFDNLYWQSQKLGSSAESIKSLGYAFSQLGSNVGEANAALNSVANFTFVNGRGATGFLTRIGVDPQHIGHAAETMKDLEVIFRRMVAEDPVNGTARATSFAGAIGISPDQLRVMLRGTEEYEKQYKQIVDRVGKAWGVSFGDMTDDSNNFMTQLRLMKAELDLNLSAALYKLLPILEKVVTKAVDWLEKAANDGTFDKFADNLSHVTDTISGLVDKVDLLIRRGAVLMGVFMGMRAGATFGPWGAVIGAIAGGIAGHEGANWLLDNGSAPANSAPNLPMGQAPSDGKWHALPTYSGPGFGVTPAQKPAQNADPSSGRVPTGGTRANRNNNPGNLEAIHNGKINPWVASLAGYKGHDGRFAVFDTPKAGYEAQVRLLHNYISKGINTVASIISKYAPKGENNTGAYIAKVSAQLGVSPFQRISHGDVERLALIQDKIEGFNVARLGVNGANGGNTVNQTNTWHVTGDNPQENARLFAGQQHIANQRLFANLTPSAQ